MKKTTSRISTGRVWLLVKKLSRLQKAKLIAQLERETRQERWNQLTEKLSRRFQDNPISDEEISQIVEEVRQERYDRSQDRS